MRAFIAGLWLKGMIVTGPVLAGTIPEVDAPGVGVLKSAELGSGLFCAAGASCTGGGADSVVAAPWGSSPGHRSGYPIDTFSEFVIAPPGSAVELNGSPPRSWVMVPVVNFDELWSVVSRSSLNIADANLADESSPPVSSELASRDGAADLPTSATTAVFGIGLIALGISRRQRNASC